VRWGFSVDERAARRIARSGADWYGPRSADGDRAWNTGAAYFRHKRHIAATSRGAPDPALGAELEKLAAEFDAAAEAARGAN
jgi:hypothetical protein